MKYFNNPVSETTKPDPYILEFNGLYYCYSTHVDGVKVSLSKDLIYWEDKGFACRYEEEKSFWAPSVIYINGLFYMYYSSVKVNDVDTLEETLKCSISNNPLGPFIFKKQFFEYFSIDSHPYFYNGDLYMFYSTNVLGCDDSRPGTCILLDKMISPLEMEGNPKIIIKPSLDQEIYQRNRFGDGRDWYTIEGASIIRRNGKLYVLYSANAYVNTDYFVNYSVGLLKDDLRNIDFKKYPDGDHYHALLCKNKEVSGTGHNTVCKGLNLIEDFIVYHGRENTEPLLLDKEQRTMRIDRLFFNGDELLCNGPLKSNIEVPKESDILKQNILLHNEKVELCFNENYILRLWWKGIKAHSSIRYGINISKNLVMEFSEGLPFVNVYKVLNNIKLKIQRIELSKDYNHRVTHCLSIKKTFNNIEISFDNGELNKFQTVTESGIEIYSSFCSIKLIDLRVTYLDELCNEDLVYLSKFVFFNKALFVNDYGNIEVKGKCIMSFLKSGTNEFDIYPLSSNSYIMNGKNRIPIKSCQSLYFESNNEECVDKILLSSVGIKRYRFTKNCNQ